MEIFLVIGVVFVAAVLIGLVPSTVARLTRRKTVEPGSLAEWKTLSPEVQQRRIRLLEAACEIPPPPVTYLNISENSVTPANVAIAELAQIEYMKYACNDCDIVTVRNGDGRAVGRYVASKCEVHSDPPEMNEEIIERHRAQMLRNASVPPMSLVRAEVDRFKG